MPGGFSFRTLPAADLPAALGIEQASYPADEAASAASLKYRVENAGGAFIGMYEASGTLAGFVCGTCTRDRELGEETMSVHDASTAATTLCVHSVVIREDLRRRGLATYMLGWYVRYVPCLEAYAHVRYIRLITKAKLIAFYRDLIGFDFVGLWPHTHGQERWFEMELPLRRVQQYQADAFTVPGVKFSGNPAAVTVLPHYGSSPPDAWYCGVALSNALSETAFVTLRFAGSNCLTRLSYDLRWFTPTTEVDLCGHATLATAHVLWSSGIAARDAKAMGIDNVDEIDFHTRHSGVLIARRSGAAPNQTVSLDFPADSPTAAANPDVRRLLWNADICRALGMGGDNTAIYVGKGKFDALVEVSRIAFAALCGLDTTQIDMGVLGKIPARGLIVTCQGGGFVRGSGQLDQDADTIDFTSRWFGPQSGVPEDPVTGSAHCSLAVYWGKKLGKSTMVAAQASPRGGILKLTTLSTERVRLTGRAAMFCEGALAS